MMSKQPSTNPVTGIVIVDHGSRRAASNDMLLEAVDNFLRQSDYDIVEPAHMELAQPDIATAFSRCVERGAQRVIVFPYFLFTGILIDRIYGFADQVAAAHPGIDWVKAGYLNDHDQVIATFAERVTEILEGQNAMNCAMCKYRAQVLGFETEVGSPQESHHHHVEGQGASAPGSNVEDCALCDTFCTGACRLDADHHHHHHDHGDGHHHHHHHDHDHHHPPYPHADHPLGPESVRRHLKAGG